jgi:hypothetical protein
MDMGNRIKSRARSKSLVMPAKAGIQRLLPPRGHCEERSDEAIPGKLAAGYPHQAGDCFALLAMTARTKKVLPMCVGQNVTHVNVAHRDDNVG